MQELEQYQKTEAYKVFSRKAQDRQKGKSHRQGIEWDKKMGLEQHKIPSWLCRLTLVYSL